MEFQALGQRSSWGTADADPGYALRLFMSVSYKKERFDFVRHESVFRVNKPLNTRGRGADHLDLDSRQRQSTRVAAKQGSALDVFENVLVTEVAV